ncbi:PIN domain-containing protein [Kribbella italica]|uniref:Putative nucleic acid-binding protein n=1 Tax=Kribbella italica TaxID=1540520 RepID=A0A7W9J4A6_9ACTN|nr:putative nucleic acid-binding protein [Kribbella italica]
MADPSRRAFLDANVLRGSLQTDVLLTLAFRDEFQPRWNAEVMDEVRRNAPQGLPAGAIERRIAQMNQAFPQAMVERIDSLEQQMQADPKDKHVLAGAVHSNSTVLVTENTKDFNPPSTGPHAMQVQRLSKFLSDLTRENPARMVEAMREMVGRNQRDPNTVSALIDKMAKQQDLRGFAQTLNSVVPEQDRGTSPQLTQGRQNEQGASRSEEAGRPGVEAESGVGAQEQSGSARSTEAGSQPAIGAQPEIGRPGVGTEPEAGAQAGSARSAEAGTQPRAGAGSGVGAQEQAGSAQSAEAGARPEVATQSQDTATQPEPGATQSTAGPTQSGEGSSQSAQPPTQSGEGAAQAAAVDPQAKAASALAFDGVAGAGTKAPAGRKTSSPEKAHTPQTPKPPEREL